MHSFRWCSLRAKRKVINARAAEYSPTNIPVHIQALAECLWGCTLPDNDEGNLISIFARARLSQCLCLAYVGMCVLGVCACLCTFVRGKCERVFELKQKYSPLSATLSSNAWPSRDAFYSYSYTIQYYIMLCAHISAHRRARLHV